MKKRLFFFGSAVSVLSIALVLMLTCSGFAATIYAAAGNTAGLNNGTSWKDAYIQLDSALAAAASGDTVQIAAGMYIPSGATFSVPEGVTVRGGWCNYWSSYGSVTEIGQFYNPNIYQVVLSGDVNGDDKAANLYGNPDALDAEPTRAENKGTILTLAGNATVEGIQFWHGGATLDEVAAGGIQCGAGGTVTVNNCEFYGCLGSNGAAVAGSSATVTVSNCYIQGNASSSAMIRSTGPLTVTNCTFKGNSNSGEYGNGIRWDTATGATLTVSDCAVLDGITGAVVSSGSLYIRGSNPCTVHVDRCVFRNDAADACSTYMGNKSSTAVQTYHFTNCLWAGCQSYTANGTILIHPWYAGGSTTVNITNCTLADNTSPDYEIWECSGGGPGGPDCWLVGYDYGSSGIKVIGTAELANSSFSLNLKNSILWGNRGANVNWDTATLSFTDTTYNPFHISYCCIDTTDPKNYPAINPISGIPTGLIVSDPQFKGSGDYHLASASPCIDKGDPASSYVNEPKWLNGCRINMGAYGNTAEAELTTCSIALTADATGDCKVGNPDLLTLRNQWNKSCPGSFP